VRIGVTAKLVLVTVGLLIVSSFGFTALNLVLSRAEVEDDLRQRAVVFAREIAATIGDRRELESGGLLVQQIHRIMEARSSVLQMDILVFRDDGSDVVATSHPAGRLPFSRTDASQVRAGHVVSRLITASDARHWEVMAPIRLEGAPVGAVGVKFSLAAAERLAARIRGLALAFTAASVVATAVLTAVAVRIVVARPVRRFMDAIGRARSGHPTPHVEVRGRDEFAALADRFNEMVDQISGFNEDLRLRVAAATAQLDRRLEEVSRLNDQLFRVQGRLRHAERLALAGRFMAQVAHEVGTPLHSVAGHLELLRRELPPALLAGEAGRRLAVVESQLGRTAEIIAQLLDVTRAAPVEAERVALDPLIAETLELVRPGVSARGIALEFEPAPQSPVVKGRAAPLQQVLLNLVTNAVDATATGGRIAIRTRQAGADSAEIEVADTGRGIPAATLKSLFEPFFTTKEPGRGTGLGLFIADQIVREHGGRIEVESQEGEGTTFRVTLPASVMARA
jgi:two-component system NtrC family sensor kinase